jgi:CBS-domain-containing membrane protein
MKPVWLRAVAAAIRRNDHRNVMAGAVAGLGAAIAIGVMEWVALAAHYPLVIIPFATSIVLVIGSPEAEPAQPRALIGGHVVATLVGLAMLRLTGPHAWAAAAAVGCGAADAVCVALAPVDPAPAMASAVAIGRLRNRSGAFVTAVRPPRFGPAAQSLRRHGPS